MLTLWTGIYLSSTQIFKRDELICSYPGHILTVTQYETVLSRLSEDEREIITVVKLCTYNGFPFRVYYYPFISLLFLFYHHQVLVPFPDDGNIGRLANAPGLGQLIGAQDNAEVILFDDLNLTNRNIPREL